MTATYVMPGARTVRIPAPNIPLVADLTIPSGAQAVVVLVDGTGAARRSACHRELATELAEEGVGSLVLDLLTSDEQAMDVRTKRLRRDTDLLAQRLAAATDWLRAQPDIGAPRIGYFATGEAAAAALIAGGMRQPEVGAIVLRRGTSDITSGYFGEAEPPTLLVMAESNGAAEAGEVGLRSIAAREKELVIVARASEQFDEPGAGAQVEQHALRWFERHLLNVTSSVVPPDATELC